MLRKVFRLTGMLAALAFAACGGTNPGTEDMSTADLATADLADPKGDLANPAADMTDRADMTNPADMANAAPSLTGVNCAAAQVTAQQVFGGIVNTICVNCHVNGSSGGLQIADVNALKGLAGKPAIRGTMNLITANNIDQSFLLYKVYGQQDKVTPRPNQTVGVRMPRNGNPLSDANLCLLVNWVRSGAN